jgi:predicted ArsR family transcriptional regulator
MDAGESDGLSIAEIAERERALEQQIDAAVRNGLEDTESPTDERVESVVAELRDLGVEPHVDNIKEMLGGQPSAD